MKVAMVGIGLELKRDLIPVGLALEIRHDVLRDINAAYRSKIEVLRLVDFGEMQQLSNLTGH
jgi:hypothetical protein